ncbi:MAG: 2-oxoglutarate dehydrogenase, E2 component, dihydrolipoamide succinyltransferase [Actinomycetota bacterium]|nr:2-oxoglutarate dehydrogenase, E2 component, dihydrolipoamide succinyltransferase [Actinomycetota bacterium]
MRTRTSRRSPTSRPPWSGCRHGENRGAAEMKIQMPRLGETIVEGTILKWLKTEGETIERDEPLFEISTDKVDTEVPSPVTGTVTKILVAEGETVAVGTELAEVSEGSDAASTPDTSGAADTDGGAADTDAPATDGGAADTDAPATDAGPSVPASAEAPASTGSEGAAEVASAAAPAASGGGVATRELLPDRGPRSQILSPLVRRLADENGLDLSRISGTGAGGRITKSDVMAAIGAGTRSAPAEIPPAAAAVAPAVVATPAAVAGPGEQLEPMSHIRKAIATHMVGSLQTTARAWTMVEVNVENLVRLRERAKDAFFERHGVKLTYLPMVTRATTEALLEFPRVNAEIRGEDLVLRKFVNMGIAVSYDQGLIVPVIRNVDAMNVAGIARAIADLAARARSHELTPDEVQGATFTITNPGPYGSLVSLPIINLPNAGILSLDAIQKRPVVLDDAIAIRHMVYLSMSWDHRVLDGELATRFLARVKQNLETWDFAEDLGL